VSTPAARASTHAATLFVYTGEGYVRELSVGQRLSIGRSSKNDLVVDQLDCSRHHAEIRARPDGLYELVDLSSRNGCFVNGTRIAGRQTLADGDEIEIAELRTRFRQLPIPTPLQVDAPRARRDATIRAGGMAAAPCEVTTDVLPVSGAQRRALVEARAPAHSAVRPHAPLWEPMAEDESPAVVLATDVARPRASGQRTDAAAFDSFVCTWSERAGDMIRRHRASVERLAGHTLVAYWLIEHPERPEPEVALAIRAAHALGALAAEVQAGFAEQFGGARFTLGVGLHLCSARLEVATRADATPRQILGDGVVVVASLEAIAEEQACVAVVSDALARCVPPEVGLRPLGDAAVRDRGRAIRALAIVDVGAAVRG
jgi:hypothetical protein